MLNAIKLPGIIKTGLIFIDLHKTPLFSLNMGIPEAIFFQSQIENIWGHEMGIFKKSIEDVDRLYQKKLYGFLADLIRYKDPAVSERAKKALYKLITDEDAKQERSKWTSFIYMQTVQYLESRKFIKYKEEIAPVINALKSEHDTKEEHPYDRLNRELDKIGMSHLLAAKLSSDSMKTSKRLDEILEQDEKIEYGKQVVNTAYLLTNKRIIYYRFRPPLDPVIIPMSYDSISPVKHGFTNIMIKSDEEEIYIRKSEKELLSHLAEYIPSLKEGL
jgi:hypothetical protein